MSTMENIHDGKCALLIDSLQLLMPDVFSFGGHQSGSETCFAACIEVLLDRSIAANEMKMTLEFAIACKEIAGQYDPPEAANGNQQQKNPFKTTLVNQLQARFAKNRQDPTIQSDEEYEQLKAEIEREKVSRKLILATELKTRENNRKLALGIVTFIANLFNVGLLGYNVIDLCLKHLLSTTLPSELDVERFYHLITLSGANIEKQQRGTDLVEKHLVRLEEVISQASFSDRINKLILGIYETRANFWNPVSPAEIDKKLERASGQLNEVNKLRDILNGRSPEMVLEFMMQFIEMKISTKETLESIVKMTFESGLAEDTSYLIAIVCKLLATTAVKNRTFKAILMDLVAAEIASHSKNSAAFRSTSARVQELKECEDEDLYHELREVLEKEVEQQQRVCQLAVFLGNLYNVDALESRVVFDYFVMLLTPQILSNTSIESYCLLVKSVGSKMLLEKNRDVLLKDSIVKLHKATSSAKFKVSTKARLMVEDVMSYGHVVLKLPTISNGSGDSNPQRILSWTTTQVEAQLWENNKPKPQRAARSSSPPPEMPPSNLIRRLPPPPPMIGQPPPAYAVHEDVFYRDDYDRLLREINQLVTTTSGAIYYRVDT